jgi:hypothetical protein
VIWLWILGILIILAVLICRTRIGVRVRFGEAPAAVLTIGPFRVPLTGEPEKEARQKPEQAKKREKKPQKKAKKSAFPKVTAADVKEAAERLWPPLRKALSRTRRSVRLDPMTVSVTIGAAEDPAAGAEVYGWASGAMYNIMPALEELVRVPDPSVHIGLDFDSPATLCAGEIGVSVRIGTAIAVAFGVGVPALRWLTALREKQTPAGEKRERAHSDAA